MNIKSKIILFTLILTIVLNSVYLFLYLVTESSFKYYHSILNRHLLLNRMSTQTDIALKNLVTYTQYPSTVHLEEYNQSVQLLMSTQSLLFSSLKETANSYTLTSYYQTIDSFFEEGKSVLSGVENHDVALYAKHLQEAIKLSEFIHRRTQDLIEQELDRYQTFYERLIKRQDTLNVFKNFVFVTTGLFSLIFALWFSKGINRPLQKLVEATKQISKGDFTIPDLKQSSRDEIFILTNTFNQMKQNIRKYVDELEAKAELEKAINNQRLKNLEYQHLLQQMELRTLQSQINPHFLFNVLNSISKLSYIEGAEQTSELINSVSKLLRYNLRQLDTPVKLMDEIANVEEYFYILKTRFRERIKFKIDIDKELLDINMPNLTLQPLVENAFVHGIEPKEEGGIIEIKGYYINDNAIIEIIDNGIGMDKHAIEKALLKEPFVNKDDKKAVLSHKETKGHSTGLGIANVKRRLEIYYASEDVMKIHSQPNGGTTIQLNFGRIWQGGRKNVENVNC